MDSDLLKRIDPEVYKETLEDRIVEDIDIVVNLSRGHAKSLHVGWTDKQMIERLVVEDKDLVSGFYDLETLQSCVSDLIWYKVQEVADWFTSKRSEFSSSYDYKYLTLEAKMGGDPIGNGFDKNLNELESDYIVAVFQRCYDDDNPYGFFLKTAYVDISPEHGVKTGKTLSKNQIEKDPNFLKDNKWEKLLYIAKDRYPQFRPRLIRKDDFVWLKIDERLPDNTKLVASIKNDAISIMRTNLNNQIENSQVREKENNLTQHRKKAELIDESDCFFTSEKFCRAVWDLQGFERSFSQHKNKSYKRDEPQHSNSRPKRQDDISR